MATMYADYNETIKVIDGIFDTCITTNDEDQYIKNVNHASFVLNAPAIRSDLDRIKGMHADDVKGFIPEYIKQFGSAYKQSFMASSGFGEATATRYAQQAMSSMVEIIDTWLAMG